MTKETILPPTLGVSAPPDTALALYDLLRRRRGILIVKRFKCAGDQDLASLHGRIVIICKRSAALEAVLIGACEHGSGEWLAHPVEEIDCAGTENGQFSRDEIARIASAGDRRAAA